MQLIVESKGNTAQQLLAHLGVASAGVPLPAKQAHGNKNASATKRGSGRHHVAGHSKDTPRNSAGAPRGFVLRKASADKQARRNTMHAVGGRRQYLRKMKQVLRDQRAAFEAGHRASANA